MKEVETNIKRLIAEVEESSFEAGKSSVTGVGVTRAIERRKEAVDALRSAIDKALLK